MASSCLCRLSSAAPRLFRLFSRPLLRDLAQWPWHSSPQLPHIGPDCVGQSLLLSMFWHCTGRWRGLFCRTAPPENSCPLDSRMMHAFSRHSHLLASALGLLPGL